MKRLFLMVVVLSFAAAAAANAQQVSVGDRGLDKFLTSVAVDYAAGKINKELFKDELKFSFGLSYKNFNILINKGYNAGDVYLLGLLHKHSGRSIQYLIRNRRPGQGWGELAHQLGIPPSELNKMRVAMKKKWKEEQKKVKKERGEGKKAKGKGKNK